MSNKASKKKVNDVCFIVFCLDSEKVQIGQMELKVEKVARLEAVSLEFSAWNEAIGGMSRIKIYIRDWNEDLPVHWTRISLNWVYGVLERYYGINIGKIMPDWVDKR